MTYLFLQLNQTCRARGRTLYLQFHKDELIVYLLCFRCYLLISLLTALLAFLNQSTANEKPFAFFEPYVDLPLELVHTEVAYI